MAYSYFLRFFLMHSGKKMHVFILVWLHRPIFNAHGAVCVNANGRQADTSSPVVKCSNRWPVPARRSSIQSTCHSCQWRDTEKWIPKRCCILTVTVAIHKQGAAYLQRAASISFTWEKERQLETELETRFRQKSIFCSHPLALSWSIIFGLNVSSSTKGH